MIAATSIYLLRHAEVEEQYQRVFGGRIDMNLSSRGHTQAASLAEYLAKRPLDAVYASPMKRVQQTLSPYNSLKNLSPVILPELREVDFGDWTGLKWDEVKERYKVSAFDWLDRLEAAAIPNAESGEVFRQRVAPAVERILKDHPGQRVAIFCHGGVIRMILAIMLGLPLRNTASFEIEYASLTQIHHYPGKTEVQLMNFTPWRDI